MREIERISLSRLDRGLAELEILNRPVLIEGFLSEDQIHSCWREIRAELIHRHGEHRVRYLRFPKESAIGRYSELSKFVAKEEHMPVAEFLDLIEEKSSSDDETAYYANAVVIKNHFPSLLDLLGVPSWFSTSPAALESPYLWMGSGDHVTGLHTDRYPNVNWLLCGMKRFSLFPPADIAKMKPAPIFPNLYLGLRSTLNLDEALADDDWPPLQNGVSVDVTPGQALYIPPYWWHGVKSFGVNVAVNYWWSQIDERQFGEIFAAFAASLYAFKTLPKVYKTAWNELFQYLVFDTSGDPYAHCQGDQGLAGLQTDEVREYLKTTLLGFIEPFHSRCHALVWGSDYILTETGRARVIERADEISQILQVFMSGINLSSAKNRIDRLLRSKGRAQFPIDKLLKRLVEGKFIESASSK